MPLVVERGKHEKTGPSPGSLKILSIPNIPVADPFGVARDPAMPSGALDPTGMDARLREVLGDDGLLLSGIRVVRHKPGKRCLVEYDVGMPGEETFTVIGKVRARGMDERSLAVQKALWNSGFGDGSRFAVPRPLGGIPSLRMWLQKKERGVVATGMLAESGDVAKSVAELSHALHSSGAEPLRRPHTMEDELRILSERLSLVTDAKPEWRGRIERVRRACEKLGRSLSEPEPLPIHRDFYGDQILVDGARLVLLDLDLFCEGAPGLDIGNFTAHMTEHSLRELGFPDAMKEREAALEERFVELSGEGVRRSVRVYETLTLARHIHISTRIPERRRFTAGILELCEERLLVGGGRRVHRI